MRIIFLFLSLSLGFSLYGQQAKNGGNCGASMVTLPQYRSLYQGYDNRFEYSPCSECDTLILKLKGADYTPKKAYSGILRVQGEAKRATVRIQCVSGSDTSNWGAFGFTCLPLPDPKVYLGNAWLSDPLIDEQSDPETIFKSKFNVRYDRSHFVSGVRFTITEWSASIGKRTYFGESAYFTKEFKDVIYESEKGDAILFNYVDVKFPDGTSRRLHINRIYYKKTEYGTKPEIKAQSIITPKSE